MAGQSTGALAPLSLESLPAPQSAPHRVMATSRKRRNHGVFLLGDELATVYSSRRVADGQGMGLGLTVGNGSLVLTCSMTPTQARAMAYALAAAATAAEAQGGAA